MEKRSKSDVSSVMHLASTELGLASSASLLEVATGGVGPPAPVLMPSTARAAAFSRARSSLRFTQPKRPTSDTSSGFSSNAVT